MVLGGGVSIVVVFLGQTITDEIIEQRPARSTHGFQHFWTQTSLEACDLLRIYVHKLRRITGKVVECM